MEKCPSEEGTLSTHFTDESSKDLCSLTLKRIRNRKKFIVFAKTGNLPLIIIYYHRNVLVAKISHLRTKLAFQIFETLI